FRTSRRSTATGSSRSSRSRPRKPARTRQSVLSAGARKHLARYSMTFRSVLWRTEGRLTRGHTGVLSANSDLRHPTERTMTRHVNGVTKAQLTEELNTVLADTERLLKSVASAGGEKAGALRAEVEQSLASAKDRLRKFEHAAVEKTHATARAADEYVHEHPW